MDGKPGISKKPVNYWKILKQNNDIIKYLGASIDGDFGVKITLSVPDGKTARRGWRSGRKSQGSAPAGARRLFRAPQERTRLLLHRQKEIECSFPTLRLVMNTRYGAGDRT